MAFAAAIRSIDALLLASMRKSILRTDISGNKYVVVREHSLLISIQVCDVLLASLPSASQLRFLLHQQVL